MPTFDHTKLAQQMRRELAGVGVVGEAIDHVVGSLIETSLRGVDSHGINLFPHYHRAVCAGRIAKQPEIAVTKRHGGTALINANHAFGHHAGSHGIRLAETLAAEVGIGAVAVADSTHFGAAAYFALQAARNGCGAFAFTNADALVRMANGTAAYFGTNPICFAAPLTHEEPFCLDMATSTVSWNKVRECQQTGAALPPGWADDANGQPTQDAAAACMLEGVGGYKGYGLSMMVELLCGMLSGGPVGRELLPMYRAPIEAQRHISHFFVAIDLDRFVGRDVFAARLQAVVDDIRQQPSTGAEPVMVPGDPEKQSYAQRIESGIPIGSELFAAFCDISTAFAEATRP